MPFCLFITTKHLLYETLFLKLLNSLEPRYFQFKWTITSQNNSKGAFEVSVCCSVKNCIQMTTVFNKFKSKFKSIVLFSVKFIIKFIFKLYLAIIIWQFFLPSFFYLNILLQIQLTHHQRLYKCCSESICLILAIFLFYKVNVNLILLI